MENGHANTTATAKSWMSHVHVTNHPLVRTKVSIIRDRKTDAKLFRELVYEIGLYVGFQATSQLSTTAEKNVACSWLLVTLYRTVDSLGRLYITSLLKRLPLCPSCGVEMG